MCAQGHCALRGHAHAPSLPRSPHPPHCLARSAADKGEATEPKGDRNYFNANSPFIFPFNPSVARAGIARAPPAILFLALMFSKVWYEEKDHLESIVVYLVAYFD